MSSANPDSWKTLPKPEQATKLQYDVQFSDSELQDISKGVIPQQMEDKWFIYSESGWVHFHRSWSGALIYWIRIEEVSAGRNCVAEAWVSRNPDEYKENDDYYDLQLLDFLVRRFLLGLQVDFPVRKDAGNYATGVVQHQIAGTGCPERLVKKPWWRFWH